MHRCPSKLQLNFYKTLHNKSFLMRFSDWVSCKLLNVFVVELSITKFALMLVYEHKMLFFCKILIEFWFDLSALHLLYTINLTISTAIYMFILQRWRTYLYWLRHENIICILWFIIWDNLSLNFKVMLDINYCHSPRASMMLWSPL